RTLPLVFILVFVTATVAVTALVMPTVIAAIVTIANPVISTAAMLGRIVNHVVLHPHRSMVMTGRLPVVTPLVLILIAAAMMMVVLVGILQGIGGQSAHRNTHQNRRRIIVESLSLIDTQGTRRRDQNGRWQQFVF